MKRNSKGRTRWLTIRLSEEEEAKLQRLYRRTTARSLSELARDLLLKEPITIRYRNQTADDFLAEMLQFKHELNTIGASFHHVINKLHLLENETAVKSWLLLFESHERTLLQKVVEIREKLSQIYELWLQK